jgi:CheY-like chemotaxis protein
MSESGRLRVLIADDDHDMADALEEFVIECNHEVVAKVTGGGLAVIQSFARYEPDVVLLDIMMPRLTGLTVCHALLSRNPAAKIIFVSGKVKSDHPFLSTTGAVGYVEKPVRMSQLREALDALAGVAA